MERAKIINQIINSLWKALKDYTINPPVTDKECSDAVDVVRSNIDCFKDYPEPERQFAIDFSIAIQKYWQNRSKDEKQNN